MGFEPISPTIRQGGEFRSWTLITRTRSQIRTMLSEAFDAQIDLLRGKPILTEFTHTFPDGRVLHFGRQVGRILQKGQRLIEVKVLKDEGQDWKTTVYVSPQVMWFRKQETLDHICRGIDEKWEYGL